MSTLLVTAVVHEKELLLQRRRLLLPPLALLALLHDQLVHVLLLAWPLHDVADVLFP